MLQIPALPSEADRRFEAIVLWSTTPAISDRTSQAILALRSAGLLVGVIAPMPLEELARRFEDRQGPDGHLLLADCEDPAVFALGSARPRALNESRAPAREQGTKALELAGRDFMAKLAELGISATSVPGPDGPLRIDIELQWDLTPRASPPALEELLLTHGIAGVPSLARTAADAARRAGIEDPRILVDANTVEIAYEDAGDAVFGIITQMWRMGVSPRDVMLLVHGTSRVPHRPPPVVFPDVRTATVVLVQDEPVSPESETDAQAANAPLTSLDDLLSDQLTRRSQGAVPEPTTEEGWSVRIVGFDVEMQRVHEALLTVADGRFGFGGSPLTAHENERPWAVAGGVYQGTGSDSTLITAPVVFRLGGLEFEAPLERILDLRTGVLHERSGPDAAKLESVRFASITRPTTTVLRASCPQALPRHESLLAPADDPIYDQGRDGEVSWIRVAAPAGGVVAAAKDVAVHPGTGEVLDRVAVYCSDPDVLPEPSPAIGAVSRAASTGFDVLLAEHRRAWAERWADADVVVEGDDELQLGIRLSLFHLMASVSGSGEAAVGARGLTGTGYKGHVFWDSDTFVLPFLAATHPASARAMLEYRVRRLPEAIEAARALGRAGARFPWESAHSGMDVTPTSARDRSGKIVPIRTGQLEEHIVADVAWASCCYIDWTGDEEFARGPGLHILVETARYWASRIRVEPDGSAHIYGVIGPDEYHEPVDDDAFTNVMARWNMRRAVEALDAAHELGNHDDPDRVERRRWLELADALVDGYDPDTGVYEQFAGFDRLEPLIIAEVAPRRPIAADLLLGAERTRASQVIKQADVLMLHHLVPDEVVAGSLEPNLRYYEPRTAHGSSLSPAVHASLLARARDFESALEALRIAARMDLDDLSGSSGQGLHLATMGGLWQALAFGFAGLRPRAGMLHVDPVLPPPWTALDLRVRFMGGRVRIRNEKAQLTISTDRRMAAVVGGTPFTLEPGSVSFRRRGPRWEITS